jgi:hypothetical protein
MQLVGGTSRERAKISNLFLQNRCIYVHGRITGDNPPLFPLAFKFDMYISVSEINRAAPGSF